MKQLWMKLLCAFALLPSSGSSLLMAQECRPSTFAGAFDGEVTLCQNWNAGQQQTFWFLSQGSQIIPYRWFLALEQAGSSEPFRNNEHMDALRYLPQLPTPMNPDGLPIGFTWDNAIGDEDFQSIADEWLGLTCSACHTGQVEFGEHKILIDGTPAMADFEAFMHALADALQETLNDEARFHRFANAVLDAPNQDNKARLREQLAVMTAIRQEWNALNAGDSLYGFARLDAIGAIFNAVTVTALGIPDNQQSANAPVSYPFIWDTPQHDVVQWNGSVPNKGAGALGRNIGEVLGVFGALDLDTRLLPPKPGHSTSVNIPHLGQLEALLWKLESPLWPETLLPPIDRSNEALGRAAFEEHCLQCHHDIDRSDPQRRIKAELTGVEELGTDPGMAANFANRRSKSGKLRRRPKNYLTGFDRFGKQQSGVDFLGYAVAGTIIYGLIHDPKETLTAINAGREEKAGLLGKARVPLVIAGKARSQIKEFTQELRGDEDAPSPLVYKARPLNGIWATAPYLHNGSVRTMRQLLQPPQQREKTFRVGSRKYAPEDVGFVNEGEYLFDTTLLGNSNLGHDYGAADLQANPEKLNALIEYLKTL